MPRVRLKEPAGPSCPPEPVLGGTAPMDEGPWAEPEQHAGKGAEPVAVAEDGERQKTKELSGGAAEGVSPH